MAWQFSSLARNAVAMLVFYSFACGFSKGNNYRWRGAVKMLTSWVHALAARIRHRGVAGRGWRHVADGRGEVDAFVCSYVGAAARYAVAACAPRSRLCLLRAGSWPRLGNPRWATFFRSLRMDLSAGVERNRTRSQVDRQTAMYT